MKLEELITQYEENRWIDCAWDDLNDDEEFESIMKYLKENKQLKEIVNIVKDWAQSEPISVSNGIKLTHEQLEIRRGSVYRLINLIRDKTGIDIGESS